MEALLHTILDNHGVERLTINCETYDERAQVLRILRDHGCDINDGRNRECYITGESRDFYYPRPEFTRDGTVTCYTRDADRCGIDFSEFWKELIDTKEMQTPIAPPEPILW